MNLENLLDYIQAGILKKETQKSSIQPNINVDISHQSNVAKLLDEENILNALKEYSQLTQKNSMFYKDYIYVSSLTSKCIRQILFEYFNYDKCNVSVYPYLGLITAVGEFVHQFLQQLLGFDYVEHEIYSEQLKVKGRIDAINILDDNSYNVIEIKTIKADELKSESFTGRIEHIRQLKFYMYLLATEQQKPVKYGQLLYISRNLDAIKVFTFEYNPNDSDVEYCINKANEIQKAIATKQIPNLDHPFIEKTKCYFCPYKEICLLKKEEFSSDLLYSEQDFVIL